MFRRHRKGLGSIRDDEYAAMTIARTSTNGWEACDFVIDPKPPRREIAGGRLIGTKTNIER